MSSRAIGCSLLPHVRHHSHDGGYHYQDAKDDDQLHWAGQEHSEHFSAPLLESSQSVVKEDNEPQQIESADRIPNPKKTATIESGSAWESNPPDPRFTKVPTVLKTAARTSDASTSESYF